MIRLPVQAHHIFHLFRLRLFPDACWEALGTRHDEHAGFDFEDVGVPEFAFGGFERFVESRGDHVFDTDEAGVGGRGIVDEALADVWLGRRLVHW